MENNTVYLENLPAQKYVMYKFVFLIIYPDIHASLWYSVIKGMKDSTSILIITKEDLRCQLDLSKIHMKMQWKKK